jgi:hypothetical protein
MALDTIIDFTMQQTIRFLLLAFNGAVPNVTRLP